MAVGAALGFKLRGLDCVAVSFFGDGASNTGAFHEGLNLAAVKDAPVLFVCENNEYAASTHVSLAMRISDIALRAQAYGFPGLVVDGMDAIAVYNSASQAIAYARSGAGPTLLEYKTFRFMGHSRGDPGGYRSKQEVEEWRRRDPIQHLRDVLTTQYSQPVGSLDQINHDILDEVESAIQFAQASPDPDPETTYQHVFAD
jgi:pyruvate dehydrogenase E1 component alpha subunit